jgi:RND family efflux transporter MFP subunit
MAINKKKLWRITITVGVILVLVLATAARLASNKKKIEAQNKVVDRSAVAIPVTVVNAFTAEAEKKFSLPAVLEAETEADITLNTSGKLKQLDIRLGATVRKGQVLGSIDNSLKTLNLASTQLLVDKYEADYKRVKELHAGNAASEVDVINAKYNFENAKMQADQIRQQIADGTVTAPCDGIIVAKNAEEGEFVNTGASIATVIDVSRLKATVTVSENDVYRLQNGMTVTIRSDVYPGETFAGEVRYISPKGDENHNYKVELSVTNKSGAPLKAGTFVRVDFELKQASSSLQVPKTALVEGLKNPYVYTVVNKKAEARKLVIGRELGDHIEVLSGISAGEPVIISGQINLSPGSPVEIVNTK